MREKDPAKTDRRMLSVFFAAAFGIPAFLSIFMGIDFGKGQDVSAFPMVWMFLPASAAMLSMLTAGSKRGGQGASEPNVLRQDSGADGALQDGPGADCTAGAPGGGTPALPKVFFLTFLGLTALMAVLAAAGVFLPGLPVMEVLNLLICISAPVCFLEMLCLKKERRRASGLLFSENAGKGLLCIALFIALYALICFLSVGVDILLGSAEAFSPNPYLWMYVSVLPVNLLLTYTAFFGEEYGWRHFLQPILQERFGKRRGVLLLGLLWGFWHLPLNLFYYSPQTGLQSFLVQIAGCVGMGVFFGWVYMKTRNIWAVTAIHFLNNNLGVTILGASPSGAVWSWSAVFLSILIYLAVYLPFLGTKEYR